MSFPQTYRLRRISHATATITHAPTITPPMIIPKMEPESFPASLADAITKGVATKGEANGLGVGGATGTVGRLVVARVGVIDGLAVGVGR